MLGVEDDDVCNIITLAKPPFNVSTFEQRGMFTLTNRQFIHRMKRFCRENQPQPEQDAGSPNGEECQVYTTHTGYLTI